MSITKEIKPKTNDIAEQASSGFMPDWTQEQFELVKRSIAKDATNDEFHLFCYRCKEMNLDPFKKEIYFVKYGTSPGTIIVGIDGFRKIAHRSGMLSGIERGVHFDPEGRLISGWAKVWRKDWQHPAYEETPLREYNTGKQNWAKMPETMIKKCAEAAALRIAFPELNGVYEQAEMDQAVDKLEAQRIRTIETQVAVAQAQDDTSLINQELDLGERVWLMGRHWLNRKLKDIPVADLEAMVLRVQEIKSKQGLPPAHERSLEDAIKYLNHRYDAAMEGVTEPEKVK